MADAKAVAIPAKPDMQAIKEARRKHFAQPLTQNLGNLFKAVGLIQVIKRPK
jgi:hypothetical protein